MSSSVPNRRIGSLKLLCWASDFFALAAAYYITLLIRFHSDWGIRLFGMLNRLLGVGRGGALAEDYELFYVASAPRIILGMSATLSVLYALRDLYPGRRFLRPRAIAWDVMAANVTALLVFYAYWYLRRNDFHPRSLFLTLILINAGFCLLFRSLLTRGLNRLRNTRDFDVCAALLVGTGKEADTIAALIEATRPHGMRVAARLRFDGDKPFDQTLRAIRRQASDCRADAIVLAEKTLSIGQIMLFLEMTEALKLPAHVLSDKLDALVCRAGVAADRFYDSPLVYFEAPLSVGRRGHRLRRIPGRIAAAVMLVALSPLLLLIALCIRLTSRGSALFEQERIGVNRVPFTMYKFRTMFEAAAECQAQVEAFNESDGALFKIKRDPRVTAVGRVLRRFSLDELPQLINVARGDMALIGPRPLPRRDFESYYEDWHYGRHAGLPGLTCLWQVSGRSLVHFQDMCVMDIYYLRNRDWILDLKILLRTVHAVFFAHGAY